MSISEKWLLPVLLALAVALTVATAGWGDLYNETDGQYGGAAKAMVEGGSWLIPENNDSPRLVKPPLLYWMMAVSMKVLGINAFAARLPDGLALTAWVAATFLIGSRLGGPWRGFVAGMILLTSLGIFTLGRIVMPEPMFAAFIAWALYCALRGRESHDRQRETRNWYVGFWVFASLASFTKGWHGVLYPLLIIALAALLNRDGRAGLRGLVSWQGILIFALINLPWYFYIESKFPGWTHNLFFAEQLGHIEGSSAPATSYDNVPRWQFFLLHLAWFFPWSPVAIFGLFSLKKTRFPRPDFGSALVIAWALIVVLSVFATGQRQDYYAMTMWPAFALGVAWMLERSGVRLAGAVVAMLFLLGLAGALALPHLTFAEETGTLAERATAWSTVTGFDRGVWESLQATALWTLGGAFVFAMAAALLKNRKNAVLALGGVGSCLALGALSGTSIVSPYFSLARVAPEIPAGVPVVYDGGLDTGSSLLFYTDSPVILLDQHPEEDFFVRTQAIGKDRYITTENLVPLWKSDSPVVLVTEKAKLEHWRKLLGPSLEPSAHCGTQIVLKK